MPLRPTAGIGYFRMSKGAVLWSMPGRSTEDYDPETLVWIGRAEDAGGSFGTRSKAWADALIRKIKNQSFDSKIVYLLPFLGSNLATARVPLRDSLGVGIAGNNGFTDADYQEGAGLQGNGTTKTLNSLIYPSQVGVSSNGGLGWWENNINLAGDSQPMGMESTTNRYVLDLRSAFYAFSWGDWATTNASVGGAATNGHYYGQRSASNLRRIGKSGAFLGSNAVADGAAGITAKTMLICGSDQFAGVKPWPGRGACAYMTDGTLTAAEFTALHSILYNYLILPTGR